MKRLFAVLLASLFALTLVACGGGSAPASDLTADQMAQAIVDSRPTEENEAYTIFTLPANGSTAMAGASQQLTQEQIDSQTQLSLSMLGLTAEDVQQAAFSVSLMNVKAYGVGVFSPAEGKTQQVKDALQEFVEAQQAAQQNYLPDQYAIAKAAKVETLKNGLVVVVMCENQDTVFAALDKALNQ